MGPRDQILARMYVVLTLLSLLPLAVAGRVVWVAVVEGPELRERGEEQANSFVELPAKRGAILDRAGRTLAVNTARYDLAVDPTVAGFGEAEATFFERLSKLTGQSAGAFRRTMRNRASKKYVRLARGLSEPQKEAIEAWEMPGVILEARFARRYNYGSTAAHLLGHTGADGEGLAGLELQYDDYLQGISGRRAAQRDRRNVLKPVVDGLVVEPKHGQTIVLTIDLIRQTMLEEELERGLKETGATWGTAVAMDPQTGAILAWANAPTFDPNRAAVFSEATRRNHAITDRMEPGSTFKLVGAVAAIEKGVIAIDDTVDTGQGWAVFHGRTMRDTHAHGRIAFADVIALSSNVGMAKTAQRLKPGDLYQYARNLGFGQPTWVDLPGEVAGTLKKPSRWSGTTLTSMSIGYEVDVTPLQLVTAYSALANGGLLVQPHLVAERRDLTGRLLWRADIARRDSVRRVFDRKTAETLRPAFERVVNEGTAKRAQVEGLSIAGKTGTARKVEDGRYGGGYRATFVGFFPADDPQVVMVVVMDEPKASIYGGSSAAPVFQRVAERWVATFPEIADRIAPPDTLPVLHERPVPDVTKQPAEIAARHLRAVGYYVDTPEPPLAPVERQVPEAGAATKPGARIRLAAATIDTTAAITMPDLSRWTARDAVFWLRSHGVETRVEGTGLVQRQSVQAGSALPEDVVLHLGGREMVIRK